MMTSISGPSLRCYTQRNFQVYFNILRHASSEAAENIVIPQRIKKGPTDVLKALAGTLSRDVTAPHYKYHDDPFLTPCSNISKRSYAMAKEAGKKAARWVQNQHPNLFQHKVSYPFIEEFTPDIVYDEDSVVDESALMNAIHKAEVSNAIKVYEILEKKGISISKDSKQSFLELLCFFNCGDTLPEEYLEERWFQQSSVGRERQRKTWKDNSLAEKIFLSFEQKDADAYSAIIQGMTRYCQVDRAWKIYEESCDKNIVLHAETYNALIRVVNFLRESTELRWELICKLLSVMAEKKLQPNIGTLNSVLEGISTMPNQKLSKEYALKTLSEFKHLNIQPSLATYYFLLIIFCRPRGPTSNILIEIMNNIQGQEFTAQDPKDSSFFVTAMDVCRNHLQDKDLAYRVDELLHTGNNYVLIGDSYKESIYYRHFFVLLCKMESLEVFMEFYNRVVPHIYTPEPAVMEEVIKSINMNGAKELLPRIWSDMVIFNHIDRDKTVSLLLNCMVENPPSNESDLNSQFGDIVWNLWTRQESIDENQYRQWRWTGQMLGDVMIVLLRADRFKAAGKIMDKLLKPSQEIMGIPVQESLQLYLDSCIKEQDVKSALRCVQYCADASYPEAEQMAQLLINSLPLDEGSIAILSNYIGRKLSKTE